MGPSLHTHIFASRPLHGILEHSHSGGACCVESAHSCCGRKYRSGKLTRRAKASASLRKGSDICQPHVTTKQHFVLVRSVTNYRLETRLRGATLSVLGAPALRNLNTRSLNNDGSTENSRERKYPSRTPLLIPRRRHARCSRLRRRRDWNQGPLAQKVATILEGQTRTPCDKMRPPERNSIPGCSAMGEPRTRGHHLAKNRPNPPVRILWLVLSLRLRRVR